MSDEENIESAEMEVEYEAKQEKRKASTHKQNFLPHVEDDDATNEAKMRLEERKKKITHDDEDFAEYEIQRKAEREIQEQDIRQLRERRERRRIERAEEEKRVAELRAAEEHKRRSEEEERQRKKREEDQKKKEEREKRKQIEEERTKSDGKRNYTITKRDGGSIDEHGEEGGTKVVQKSKEQLESERKAALEQRYHKLNTHGMSADQLRAKAKELYDHIHRLESEKYDLIKRFESQNYDLMEMTEKARNLVKGGGNKNQKSKVSQTEDPLASKFSGIPQKVQMYSEYERVKDHRSFGDRRDLYTGPLYSEEYKRIEPTRMVTMTEQGAQVAGAPVENHNTE